MKVKELIEMLGDLNPEANVYVMSQSNYPFECALHGVVERQDFVEYDDVEGGVEITSNADRWTARDANLPRNDVFFVEGTQLRYGAKGAWEAARRR
jgi:hypothetical protein